ncbi:tyrosine-type recombinase/integrase [Gordonia sp. NB41Y]|uniref:site-specific integrase n=1 Tax=Gordonia sp. NB41Y TaxID=875808 RepID=UPI0002C02604|nr:tyrosine-type recombinase/integrase [Gordonia sp. NB41Y]EMP15348.1 integrase [Gordonia sp. NB41Y]WLP89949.1 tyrosine-type recombinase/integrase [Gordonia sp. NB41Y]
MSRRAEPITKRTAKNGTVSYTFQIDVGTKPDGGRLRQRFTYRTVAEARREYRRIATEVESGKYVGRHSVTVAEYLTGWLDGRRDIRAGTLANYRQALRPVVECLGGIGLQQLTKAHIDELVTWRMESGRSTTAARLSDRAVRVLGYVATHPDGVTYSQVESECGANAGKFLDRLRASGHVTRPSRGRYVAARVADDEPEAQGIVVRNVAEYVERPKAETREMAAWAQDQAEAFRVHVENERRYALWLLTLYGLRRSEVLGLRWNAIDFDAGTVAIVAGRVVVPGGTVEGDPKSARSRRVLPMPSDVIAALRSFKAAQAAERLVMGSGWTDTGLVAVNADGSPIRPETYSAEFRRMVKVAGLPRIRLHDVRHTSVSLMMARGVPVLDVAKWHGHDPAMTLRVYGHVDGDALARAGASLFGQAASE